MKHNLYIGNIMQCSNISTDKNIESVEHNENGIFIKKESAVLYKTKMGAYVDLDEAKEKSKFLKWNLRKANKIDTNGNNQTFGNDIIVMPAISLSEINDTHRMGFSGIFVDEDSLIPYIELEKKEKETKIM